MDIRIPLFHDEHTPEFEGKEAFLPPPPGASLPGCPGSPANGHASVCSRLESVNETETAAEPCVPADAKTGVAEEGQGANGAHVHMDAMAFGMGCCCLQVTFQVSLVSVVVFWASLVVFWVSFVSLSYSRWAW